MSASTIDRLLRVARAGDTRHETRVAWYPNRAGASIRTFTDWNDPATGQHGNGLGGALRGNQPAAATCTASS